MISFLPLLGFGAAIGIAIGASTFDSIESWWIRSLIGALWGAAFGMTGLRGSAEPIVNYVLGICFALLVVTGATVFVPTSHTASLGTWIAFLVLAVVGGLVLARRGS